MARFETHQEIINHIVPFLKKQGKRGGDQLGKIFSCQYVSSDGSRCAIGACFENIDRVPRCEISIEDLQYDFPELYDDTFGPDVDLTFLEELQAVHDSAIDEGFWPVFAEACQMLCNRWDLTMPEVN